ncbi:MAG TPA: hypothetical protein VK814_10470 [Acidobacteriaceae bacterium]|nr:hypothetical protein [Acidobacteriaceae bacterium]
MRSNRYRLRSVLFRALTVARYLTAVVTRGQTSVGEAGRVLVSLPH